MERIESAMDRVLLDCAMNSRLSPEQLLKLYDELKHPVLLAAYEAKAEEQQRQIVRAA